MAHEDDVERLFSWLKSPDLRYREFADAREVTDAVAPWPIVQAGVDTTAGETPEPGEVPPPRNDRPEGRPAPEYVAPAGAAQTSWRSEISPHGYSGGGRAPEAPSPVPGGGRLMQALGRRVREARFGTQPELKPRASGEERIAQYRRAAAQDAETAAVRAGEAELAAAAARDAAERTAAEQAMLAERARAEAATRAEAEAAMARRRAEAERRGQEAAARAAAEAAARRAAAEAAARERAQAEAAAMRIAAERAETPQQNTPAPSRSGLFGGSYRTDRAGHGPEGLSRQSRPLDAVFSRLSRPGPSDAARPANPDLDRPR